MSNPVNCEVQNVQNRTKNPPANVEPESLRCSDHMVAVLPRCVSGVVDARACRVIEVVVRLLLMGVCGWTVIGFLKLDCCHKK